MRAGAAAAPRVALGALETLWFQVAGTLCNLACTHCFVSCSPTNHTHEMMTLAEVLPHLEEGAALGVKEYYFTGGEPFLNPEMEAILATATRGYGPATVLTNGLLLDPGRCRAPARRSPTPASYSLDLRVSLDGAGRGEQRRVRGAGAFARAPAGIRNLAAVGLNPVVTATEVYDDNGTAARQGALLRAAGDRSASSKPRLKLLPMFRIGAEAERGGAYASWQRLAAATTPERSAGTTCSAAAAGWSPARGCGSARSSSTSRRRAWGRPSPTPSARRPSATPPAGPATSTA